MKILNLTQHKATKEQKAAGVVEPPSSIKTEITNSLTFNKKPTRKEINQRAEKLTLIADLMHFKYVMIGGAPFSMAPLEAALKAKGIKPLYAFSKRVSTEIELPDGSIEKQTIFKHEGFIHVI